MSNSLPLPRWYALHVRSRHEKNVSAQLGAKQCDVFLPLYAARHRWADRWKMLSLPLFPGYVFCRFEASNQSHVLATSGIIDVVRVGGQAAPVETSEIEAIVRIVNSPVPAEPYSTLVGGERVMLGGGPLSGLAGTLVEIRNGLRLVISVELLCRSVLVEIERDWVVASRRSETNYRPGQGTVSEFSHANHSEHHSVVCDHGKVLAACANRRIRSESPAGGSGAVKETVPLLHHGLGERAKRLVAELRWSGPIMVEFKTARADGVPRLMEINGRFWGSLPLAVAAGLDFPYLYYRLACGEQVEPTVNYQQPVVSRHFMADLMKYPVGVFQE